MGQHSPKLGQHSPKIGRRPSACHVRKFRWHPPLSFPPPIPTGIAGVRSSTITFGYHRRPPAMPRAAAPGPAPGFMRLTPDSRAPAKADPAARAGVVVVVVVVVLLVCPSVGQNNLFALLPISHLLLTLLLCLLPFFPILTCGFLWINFVWKLLLLIVSIWVGLVFKKRFFFFV